MSLDLSARHVTTRAGSPARLALALIAVTTAASGVCRLAARYAMADGLGTGAAGLAFAAYVGGALPMLLAGAGLPDRLGRGRTLSLALGLAILADLIVIARPGLAALGLSRALLGIAVAATSTLAPAFMTAQFAPGTDPRRIAARVSVATTFGFGFGAAMTELCLIVDPLAWMRPLTFLAYPALAGFALLAVSGLPQGAGRRPDAPMLRRPTFPAGTLPFGFAILVAWAVVGVVIAVLPATLARAGLDSYAGLATFLVIVPGILAVPAARRMTPETAIRHGLLILIPAYALIAWGALDGRIWAVLTGTALAATSCYGLVHAGGLAGVLIRAGQAATGATAGFYLLAYLGFSLPVIVTGRIADLAGQEVALGGFGAALVMAVLVLCGLAARTSPR